MAGQHQVFLSIGSNVGNKKDNLDRAIEHLNAHNEVSVLGVSGFYKTEPQNFIDQDWFVNAAVKIQTGLDPLALLNVLKRMEKELDKDGKPFRFGPRIIDLDIILYDDITFQSDRLEIPHPRMHKRCFVLVPMCDIGAHTIHPVLKLKMVELLNRIEKKQSQEVLLLDKEG